VLGVRRPIDEKLAALDRELSALERREFELARQTPQFEALLPEELRNQFRALDTQAAELKAKTQAFDQAKEQYGAQYGREALDALKLEAMPVELPEVGGASSLDDALRILQTEQASLSQNWIAQKDTVTAITIALAKQTGSTGISGPNAPPEKEPLPEEAAGPRILRKRMKYLEREIRRRLDQVQDWEQANEERMAELERLLDSGQQPSRPSKFARAALRPITGTYRLTRAFLFGLPNRHRQLALEAERKVIEGAGGQTPSEREEIRTLQDEIELQSVLIQGRAEEISKMKDELDTLRGQARAFPDFEYPSMLIDRFPAALENSLEGARALFEGRDSTALIRDRLVREQEKLGVLTRQLGEVDEKISLLANHLERAKREPDAGGRFGMSAVGDITPGAELASGSGQGLGEQGASVEQTEERVVLESRLAQMKSDIDEQVQAYRVAKGTLDQALFEWYREAPQVREVLAPMRSEEGRAIHGRLRVIGGERLELDRLRLSVAEEEKMVVQSKRDFLNRKLEVLQKRLNDLKRPSGDLEEAIRNEMERTSQIRDQLMQDARL